MERNDIDKVFEIGFLIVTVIAVTELQFTSFVLGQNQLSQAEIWIQVIFVFKGILIPMFVLVAIWLVAMIFPHVKVPLARRRYLKEFCLALLGNVLALEIVLFNILSVSGFADSHIHMGSVVIFGGGIFQFIPSFFLTLLATWQYRGIDSTKNQSSIKFGLTTVIEHGLIYSISYFLLLIILSSSVFLLQ
jgi:hypothetical protein